MTDAGSAAPWREAERRFRRGGIDRAGRADRYRPLAVSRAAPPASRPPAARYKTPPAPATHPPRTTHTHAVEATRAHVG